MEQLDGDMIYRGIDRRRSPREGMQRVVMIDGQYRVKYFSTGTRMTGENDRLLLDGGLRLRPEIEMMVAKLITEGSNASHEPIVALLDEDRVLRVSRLDGPDGLVYALIVGTNHNRDSLIRAAGRYELTRRQSDVLALILEGDSVPEIAEALCITENTVQGYVKTLLSKTKSRNRPAMVAKVLDWNHARSNQASEAVERRGRTA